MFKFIQLLGLFMVFLLLCNCQPEREDTLEPTGVERSSTARAKALFKQLLADEYKDK